MDPRAISEQIATKSSDALHGRCTSVANIRAEIADWTLDALKQIKYFANVQCVVNSQNIEYLRKCAELGGNSIQEPYSIVGGRLNLGPAAYLDASQGIGAGVVQAFEMARKL